MVAAAEREQSTRSGTPSGSERGRPGEKGRRGRGLEVPAEGRTTAGSELSPRHGTTRGCRRWRDQGAHWNPSMLGYWDRAEHDIRREAFAGRAKRN
jgi:hypothetical protein